MFVTVVALLCTLNSVCVEEIVTDSNMDRLLTLQGCLVHGPIGISKWMAENPTYHAGYELRKWKCVPGHYVIAGRA